MRLTKRMPDGSYQANQGDLCMPGENSYGYKVLIIDKCGRLEDLMERIIDHHNKNDMIMDVMDDAKELGLL